MNRFRNIFLFALQLCSISLLIGFIAGSARAQARATVPNDHRTEAKDALESMPRFSRSIAPAGFHLHSRTSSRSNTGFGSSATVTPMAGNLQVAGSGTLGRLTKWTGLTSSNSIIGDSSIFESKTGLVGIGIDAPTSRLTVAGMIETTLGGLKFPDGTVQSTAAVTGLLSVVHDPTLQGNGTAAQPLGLAVPLIFSGNVSDGNGVITVTNTAAGGPAAFATGGNGNANVGGGSGLLALGGNGLNASPGGVGLVGFGGAADGASGGAGGSLIGGVSTNGSGGDGLFAVGALGVGAGKKGGRGVVAISGSGASGATAGLAGEFVGDVSVSGNLSKGGGSFKIDHPLDPENKYLYHSFVESPDMKNIYDGVIRLDTNGEAIIAMPDWFSALNRDFRYFLTPIGAPMPGLFIAEELQDNRFRVAGGQPGMKISWQVTGIRQDAYANKNRIKTEEDKPEQERGFYLHPDAFNQPAERGIEWSRYAEMMQRMKQTHPKQL